jgi:glycosyltransferase involved in cell wall biosynthesis
VLVSAVMPTRARLQYARISLECWRLQTWPDKEIIIIDHAGEPSFPDGLEGDGIAYVRIAETRIGTLRNEGCKRARGTIIANWDDDDQYGPNRIANQVARLGTTRKSVTGYRNILFTDGERKWMNTNWPGGYGASLCYRRSWWESHPFPDSNEEDWAFVAVAMNAAEFVGADAGTHMIATIHPGNTAKRTIGQGWIPID